MSTSKLNGKLHFNEMDILSEEQEEDTLDLVNNDSFGIENYLNSPGVPKEIIDLPEENEIQIHQRVVQKEIEFIGIDDESLKKSKIFGYLLVWFNVLLGKIVLLTNCRNGELGHFLALNYLRKGCYVIACSTSLISMSYLEDGKLHSCFKWL